MKENESDACKHLDMLQKVSGRTGCAMLVIMHTRKGGDDTDLRNSLRGSAALFDAAQTVYMLQGSKGKPTKVENLKDRILGQSRDMFGITVKDEARHGDPRWGLEVAYVHTADVQTAWDYADEPDDMAANLEALRTLMNRTIEFVRISGEQGSPLATIKLMAGGKPMMIQSALVEAERNGSIRREGSGTNSVYFAV
jgi:hypothetical protein